MALARPPQPGRAPRHHRSAATARTSVHASAATANVSATARRAWHWPIQSASAASSFPAVARTKEARTAAARAVCPFHDRSARRAPARSDAATTSSAAKRRAATASTRRHHRRRSTLARPRRASRRSSLRT